MNAFGEQSANGAAQAAGGQRHTTPENVAAFFARGGGEAGGAEAPGQHAAGAGGGGATPFQLPGGSAGFGGFGGGMAANPYQQATAGGPSANPFELPGGAGGGGFGGAGTGPAGGFGFGLGGGRHAPADGYQAGGYAEGQAKGFGEAQPQSIWSQHAPVPTPFGRASVPPAAEGPGGPGAGGDFGQLVQAEAPVDAPDCPCGAGPCQVLTAHTASNEGRRFAKCPQGKNGGTGCNFFKWIDGPGPEAEAAAAEAPGCPCGKGRCQLKLVRKDGPNQGREFWVCPDSQGIGANGCGYFAWRDDPTGGAGQGQRGPAPEGPPCPCGGGNTKIFTARTAANDGRQFARCPTRNHQANQPGCGYFQWLDEIAAGVAPPERPPCPCGQGPCTVRTVRKEGANQGRQFAKCPMSQGPGQEGCGYFAWLDEIAAGTAGGAPGASGAGGAGGGSRVCFKCGQPGHWARECQAAGLGPGGAAEGGKGGFGGFGGGGNPKAVGECFKCGQPGHWASSCPNVPGGGGGAPYGGEMYGPAFGGDALAGALKGRGKGARAGKGAGKYGYSEPY